MPARLISLYRKLGRIEKVFLVLFILTWVLSYAAAGSGISLLVLFATIITGVIVAVRLAATVIRKLIWRLRNRLIVAYAFIAVVPIVLILALVAASTDRVTGQIAAYLVNSELERRINVLKGAAETILRSPAHDRPELIARTADFTRKLFPATEVLVDDGEERRYPPASGISLPSSGWKDSTGIVVQGGHLFGCVYLHGSGAEVVIRAPLAQEFLSNLVPGIGDVDFLFSNTKMGLTSVARQRRAVSQPVGVPPEENFLDVQVDGAAPVPIMYWDTPGQTDDGLLLVHTRLSAVLGTVFGNSVLAGKMSYRETMWFVFLATVILFLIVELVSLVIGVSITRTITSAVHELYLGTRRVKEGDFSHRIPVRGNDQLAELGGSFNTMTENLERLIVVAKEKERLQSELEIAREVQSQLFPKDVLDIKTLSLTGVCNPARVVSGDYYDFMSLPDSRLAFAIGDVAGKGISAALLMAAIQSTMRMQLTSGAPTAGSNGHDGCVSTASMVSRLNKHLYANTSPEKFATFYFALYEETSSMLTYTNAGHLPPILLHNGVPELLEVTGTVVGAFPFAQYEEKQVHMACGDVLVAYTDGIVEPENEYGEMFGEQRLTDLLAKNAYRESGEIIARVMESVAQWSGTTTELADDMTILVARRA